ncbi:MAG: penicillin acylase family protein [Myxococcales bacterium]|nr:penicillin acylase family protein [Myxococcales bacterium]
MLLPWWLACGDDGQLAIKPGTGPFDALPTEELEGNGLRSKVEIVRDKHGVPHIYAKTSEDAAYAQGFVTAHDRLTQMDTLRRFGAGTLAEMFGSLDPSTIDTDIRMRVQRIVPLATESFALMKASSDPTDQAVVRSLERYADGVNEYVRQLRTTDRWSMDPAVSATFSVQTFPAWTAVDSLVLARFQSLSLSFSADVELMLSELAQKMSGVFDGTGAPEMAARGGIIADLLRFKPLGQVAPISEFPNVVTDTGTRSDLGRSPRSRRNQPSATVAAATAAATSVGVPAKVPLELYEQARTMFPKSFRTGPLGALGPDAFMGPRAGSNSWAVAPSKAGGKVLLATDQHLELPNPSIFYPSHLVVEGELDAFGVTFPGIPGLLLGSNGNVAWSATVAYHDVNDVYAETVAPCGSADCVSFRGAQVPIQKRTEIIKVGLLGNITSQREVTLEVVPHHGPILPLVRDGAVVPRSGSSAFSVRYTGYSPSFEIRTIWELNRAKNIDQGFAALRHFSFGGQNWTMIDNSGNIGWTSHVKIPVRSPGAVTNGNVPWLVLPGNGSAEWEDMMFSRYVPHSINPSRGYLATANSDPTGQTFDGNPLNQPLVNGRPLYVGAIYNVGVRMERISNLLDAALAKGPLTLSDLSKIQHDSSSTIGAKLTPKLLEALAYVDNTAGAPADVVTYLGTLTQAQRDRLIEARTLLAAWSFGTPAATSANATTTEIRDSGATSLFNMWMHFFMASTVDDELTRATFDRSRLRDNHVARIVYTLLAEPATTVRSATTQQPILCDRLDVAGPDDSCTRMAISSTLAALDHLASSAGFGSAAPTAWRWGAKHRLTITPLFPNAALNLPTAAESPGGGFSRAGDTFVINRSDAGWHDTDFAQFADGAAQRFLAEAENGKKIRVKWQLPGGAIFDSRSPHYRDMLDNYYLKETHLDVPLEVSEVAASGEQRWTMH